MSKLRRGRNYIRVILTELNRHGQPHAVAGNPRSGYRRDHAALLYLPRPGRNSQDFRKVLRRAADHARLPHRRLQYETYDGFEQEVKKFLKFVTPKIDEYEELLTTNRIWVERTKDVGMISAKDCIALGVTGPVLRASGVKWDLRKAQPYAAYDEFRFRYSYRRERRHLRPVYGAHAGDAPIAAHHRAGDRKDSRRARSWPRSPKL